MKINPISSYNNQPINFLKKKSEESNYNVVHSPKPNGQNKILGPMLAVMLIPATATAMNTENITQNKIQTEQVDNEPKIKAKYQREFNKLIALPEINLPQMSHEELKQNGFQGPEEYEAEGFPIVNNGYGFAYFGKGANVYIDEYFGTYTYQFGNILHIQPLNNGKQPDKNNQGYLIEVRHKNGGYTEYYYHTDESDNKILDMVYEKSNNGNNIYYFNNPDE